MRTRGLGYVGAAALGAFIISAGAQITRLQSRLGPTHDLAVWPLLLIAVSVVALLASAAGQREH